MAKQITNLKEHSAAVARLSALISLNPKVGTSENDEMKVLAVLLEDYERHVVPPPTRDPVEAILFRMDQMQLTRQDLIPYLGSLPKVSEVLSLKRSLSLSMIRRLHDGLGIPAELLIESSNDDSDFVIQDTYDETKLPLNEVDK